MFKIKIPNGSKRKSLIIFVAATNILKLYDE